MSQILMPNMLGYMEAILRDAGPPLPITDPNLNSIDADGWQANYTNPPTFDPVGDPKYAVVQRTGHNSAGSSTTVTDSLEIMSRIRQAYPNQASLTANNVGVADFVYSSDVITGVTNNSTRAYPKPICLWLDHDIRTVYNQSYTAKLTVAHWHARNGRPVAAVEITATDGTTTISSGKITSMTSETYSVTGLTVPHFEHTFDFSTLNDDVLITIDAIIYPWVGPSWTASTDFATYPHIDFCEMKVLNLSTEGPVYAYIDGVGAGSPAVSENAATAATTPFATDLSAMQAIQAYNNTTYSRNDVAGGIIRLTATTHTITDFSAIPVGDGMIVIEAADAADKATTIFQNTTSGGSGKTCAKLKFKDITLKQNNASDIFLGNGALDGDHTNMLVTENCVWDDNGIGSFANLFVYRTGRWWSISDEMSQAGLMSNFSARIKKAIAIGTKLEGSTSALYHSAGSKDLSAEMDARNGGFWGFSHFGGDDSPNSRMLKAVAQIDSMGLAIVGNVFERRAGTQATAQFSADGVDFTADNIVIQSNTFAGDGRLNIVYNDDTVPYDKVASFKFNVVDSLNIKSDVTSTDGALTGNWSNIHKVAFRLNTILRGASSGVDAFAVGSWLGEYAGLGETTGSNATPLVADYTDDRSSYGTAAGDGDYTPGGSTVIPTYGDAALLPYSIDQKGNALSASSYTGAIGG